MTIPISVQIRQDTREVERLLSGYERGADKVIARALNRVIKPVESFAVRSMAKDLRVPQKDVRKAVSLRRASWRNKQGEITVRGQRLPLKAFGARQVKRGVSYRAQGGGRATIKGAFIATMSSGHEGVFKRLGKPRLPITELHGASLPYVFVQRHVQRGMDKLGAERWRVEVRRQLKYFLRNARG